MLEPVQTFFLFNVLSAAPAVPVAPAAVLDTFSVAAAPAAVLDTFRVAAAPAVPVAPAAVLDTCRVAAAQAVPVAPAAVLGTCRVAAALVVTTAPAAVLGTCRVAAAPAVLVAPAAEQGTCRAAAAPVVPVAPAPSHHPLHSSHQPDHLQHIQLSPIFNSIQYILKCFQSLFLFVLSVCISVNLVLLPAHSLNCFISGITCGQQCLFIYVFSLFFTHYAGKKANVTVLFLFLVFGQRESPFSSTFSSRGQKTELFDLV